MGADPTKDALFLAITEVGERHIKPRYKKGEGVFLKEPYRVLSDTEEIVYMFDLKEKDYRRDLKKYWKNKMFMPESAARYFIEITDVRVERLQDISENDAISEGIERSPSYCVEYKNYLYPDTVWLYYSSPIKSFKSLWNSINKPPYDWGSNPFNWVYKFKLFS